MAISIILPTGKKEKFIFRNIIFIPDFHISLVSHRLIKKKGFWFDGWNDCLRHSEGGTKICQLEERCG